VELFRQPDSQIVLASDLQWDVIDSFDSAHDKITQYLADGFHWKTKFKNGNDANYGLARDINLETYPAGSHFVSIACLAATNPLFAGSCVLLLLENTTNPDFGCIAIGLLNGNVLLDKTIEHEDIEVVFDDFTVLCERANRHFYLWGDVATFDKRPYDHAYTFAELIDPKQKTHKNARLSILKSTKPMLIFIAVAAFLAILLAALTCWEWYQDNLKKSLESARQQALSPAVQYQQNIDRFFASKVFSPTPSMGEIHAQLKSIPITFRGWQLLEINCSLPECDMSWKSVGGTYDDFRLNAPESWKNINFVSAGSQGDLLGDLKSIRNTLSLTLTSKPISPRVDWPTSKDFAWHVGESWQKLAPLGWKGSLQAASLQEVPANVPVSAVQTYPNAIFGIAWRVDNQPWWLNEGLSRSFGNNVAIKNLVLKVDDKDKSVTFNASGVAYVQK
jgi:hypothetical protein